jgi:hypothetical protein
VRQGKPEVDTERIDASEAFPGDADDREVARPDADRFAEDRTVAAKVALPEAMAQDDDIARRDLAVFGRSEEPA